MNKASILIAQLIILFDDNYGIDGISWMPPDTYDSIMKLMIKLKHEIEKL